MKPLVSYLAGTPEEKEHLRIVHSIDAGCRHIVDDDQFVDDCAVCVARLKPLAEMNRLNSGEMGRDIARIQKALSAANPHTVNWLNELIPNFGEVFATINAMDSKRESFGTKEQAKSVNSALLQQARLIAKRHDIVESLTLNGEWHQLLMMLIIAIGLPMSGTSGYWTAFELARKGNGNV